jgi:hypothetical protein
MAEKDITRINVGNFSVSIIGIKQLMDEMAGTHADKPDEEVRSFMLDRLGKDNYIPAKAKEDYGRAFLREFRKALGQPYTDDAPRGLDVKVLGAGCSQCHQLTQMIMEVLTELELPAGVDHVMDIKEIARYGIMGSPALLINGKAVAVGSVPPRERIKKWLLEASATLNVK